MFSKLSSLLDQVKVHLTISKKGDVISVTAVPKTTDKEAEISNQPFSMNGTAAELDKEFADTFMEAVNAAMVHSNNKDAFVKGAEEKVTAEKKADAKKPATTSTKADAKKPEASKDPFSDMGKPDKKLYADIRKCIDNADKKRDDEAMINYHEKEAIGKADKITDKYKARVIEVIKADIKEIREKPAGDTKSDAPPAEGLFAATKPEEVKEKTDDVADDDNDIDTDDETIDEEIVAATEDEEPVNPGEVDDNDIF